jgi:HlyD family secretion protein
MTRYQKTVVMTLAGLAAAGLASCSLGRQGGGNIRLSGNIELTQVDIAFKTSGRMIELSINEGDRVTAGQVIARLDSDQLRQQRNRDHAARVAAETALPQLQTTIEQRKASLAAELELRKAEVHQAEAGLQELLAGSRQQEIAESKAAVEQARAQLLQAQQDWERAQVLHKNDDISTAQRDQYKARLDTNTALLRQAEERAALVMEGPRKEEIESARARLNQARASLRLSETGELDIRRMGQELQTRRAEVESASAQVAFIDAQIQDTLAMSPVNGVVLVKSAEPGEVLAAGTTVVSIGEMDRPWMRGYITEPDLGRVKLGGRVRLTTDSYPGKVYWGKITFISSEAEFTPKQIQTPEERVKLVYRIKIEMENPNQELKLNMPVDAEILLEEKQ